MRQSILGELTAANRFTPDVNDAYSHLTAAFYATQADRLGMTPEELHAQYPLKVAAEDVSDGTKLDQPVVPGRPEAPTDSPAFKKWFGDSKAVTPDGKPVTVYHGTNQPIDSFDAERLGAATGKNSGADVAHFFSSDPHVASMYAANAGKITVPDAKAHEATTARLTAEMNAAEKRGDWDAHEAASQKLEDHEIGATRETGPDTILPVVGERPLPGETLRSATDEEGD